jgi:hypothetical protein
MPNPSRRVLRRFLAHGEALRGCKALRIYLGAFFVAQDGDAARGQPLGQVLKGTVGPNGLVAVVGPGTVHQDDRRHPVAAAG